MVVYGISQQGKSSQKDIKKACVLNFLVSADVQKDTFAQKGWLIMREVVQKVYKFNELEKKVQEKVLERERYAYVDGMNWWAYMIEDFGNIMYADHLFCVDEDSVSFALYSQGAGAGFTGEFETAQAAINVALAFDLKGDVNKASILDEIREYGEVRVSHNSWSNTSPRKWNTYIELLIDGVPMEEDEKYAPFVNALEEWKDEECARLYENAQDAYEYYTCDNYIRTELEEGNYEFLADGTDF